MSRIHLLILTSVLLVVPSRTVWSDVLLSDRQITALQSDRTAGPADPLILFELGRPIPIGSKGLKFILRDITEDSRCPAEAHCVWAGRVKALFWIELPNEPDEPVEPGHHVEIVYTAGRKSIERIDNYILEILEVKPLPGLGRQIPDGDYRISARVVRAKE